MKSPGRENSTAAAHRPRVVYSPHYNIGAFGLERLHPFDSRKYGRAWRCLRRHFGSRLREMWTRPRRPVHRDELLAVHVPDYLDRLRQPQYVAEALEVPPVHRMPAPLIDWCVLRPMRWATMGTILAAREALRGGIAVNLGGGYHHAKPDGGEGFCIYCDIPLAVAHARMAGLLNQDGRVACIDLDAHQGNGVCHAFMNDRSVFIFDLYNAQVYPAYDTEAQRRIDCPIRVTSACSQSEYLAELQERLPVFLDSLTSDGRIGLAIYNAGTDVFAEDPLGGLNLSAAGILQRDLFVVREVRRRRIPCIMLLSGGYTRMSYRLVADSVTRILEMPESGLEQN